MLQVMNIFHVLTYIVIFLSLIEIIIILFGNELIKYFDLENKYPKLSVFFKLRAKLQKYYLIYNFFLIVAMCILGTFLDIFVFLT